MARFRLARPAQIDLANILATSGERWGAEGRRSLANAVIGGCVDGGPGDNRAR